MLVFARVAWRDKFKPPPAIAKDLENISGQAHLTLVLETLLTIATS